MKKYLYLTIVALLATMSFALTSCGDDDDEPNGGSKGKFELTIDGTKHEFTRCAGSLNGSQNTYNWDLEYGDYPDGATFSITIYGWDEVVEGQYFTYNDVIWGEGADPTGIDVAWFPPKGGVVLGGITPSGNKIKVVAKTSKTITLSFDDATFESMSGDSVTVDGTVTLPVK